MKNSIKNIHNTITDECIPIYIIEHIANITFQVLDTYYGECTYCKNFKNRYIKKISSCKIKGSLTPKCCYYDINTYKFAKKQYYNLYIQSFLQIKDKFTPWELQITEKNRKKIIYQSIQVYDTIQKSNKFLGETNV